MAAPGRTGARASSSRCRCRRPRRRAGDGVYSGLELYGLAALLLAGAAILGQGLLCACGLRRASVLAPAIGLAGLVVIAGATVRLPGRAVTAAAVGCLAIALAGVVLWR